MNQSFLNPFSTPSIPESVHQVLGPREDVSCPCARFNPRGLFAGQYVASARSDGLVVIYDVETGGILRVLEGHVKGINSLAWSETGRFMATAGADWNVVLWDLKRSPAERVRTIRFDGPVASVEFAPRCSKLLVVILESQQAIVVDLRRRRRRERSSVMVNGDASNGLAQEGGPSSPKVTPEPWQTLEVRLDLAEVHEKERRSKQMQLEEGDDEGSLPKPLAPITTIKFHPSGAYLFAGTSRGDLLAFSLLHQGQLVSRLNASGASAIREIALDKSGKSLVLNSNDRSIRIVSINISAPSSTTEDLAGLSASNGATTPLPNITMQVVHRFQDLVNRTPWNGIGFSGDGEYVYAGAAHKAAHNVYIWDRGAGALDKILEGPKEPLVDADWHPTRPLILSVGLSGTIHIWFTPNAENWSAYAPGFEELEENIVYEEGEDEFDLEDEDEISRRKRDEEEVDVDVLNPGTWPGSSAVIPVKEIVNPKAVGLDPRPISDVEAERWEYEWDEDPESLQEDFALYVQLEEEELDEEGMGGEVNGH